MPEFAQLSLLFNLAVFALAAAAVWGAGTRISQYADRISEQTGLGHAVIGLILVAGVTSTPELAVSLTSAWSGNAALAVNNIIGGIALQLAFLAVADFAIGRAALTSVIPAPVVILQGAVNVVLLGIVTAGILVGDRTVFGVGLWVWFVLAASLIALRHIVQAQSRRPWLANPDLQPNIEQAKQSSADSGEASHPREGKCVLAAKTLLAAAVIFVAGFVVSRTGEAIAEQTMLGPSFVGAVLLAFATSLPEISTVVAAIGHGFYTMAIANIFGTTLFNVALLFPIDAVASGDGVLNRVGEFSAAAALLCIILTSLFLAGLAERRDRTVLRMGLDSIAVLGIYSVGLIVLYNLR
jgi:cation:H+ antiporter